jgi:hypothetical protein
VSDAHSSDDGFLSRIPRRPFHFTNVTHSRDYQAPPRVAKPMLSHSAVHGSDMSGPDGETRAKRSLAQSNPSESSSAISSPDHSRDGLGLDRFTREFLEGLGVRAENRHRRGGLI